MLKTLANALFLPLIQILKSLQRKRPTKSRSRSTNKSLEKHWRRIFKTLYCPHPFPSTTITQPPSTPDCNESLSLSVSVSLSPVIFCNRFGGTWQLQSQPSDNSMATSIQLSWEPKTLTCKWSPHQSAEEVERNTLMTMCFKLQFFCSFAFCEDGFHLWRA
jgi:hypothetical protein